jgi:hypothetical protein
MAWEWNFQTNYFITRAMQYVDGVSSGLQSLEEAVQQYNKAHPERQYPSDEWSPKLNISERRRLENNKLDLSTHRDWEQPIPKSQRLGECNAFSIFRSVEMS